MSRRKKKLHARRHQPWYQKKAKLAQQAEDALRPRLLQAGMASGRMSSSQPNISNIRRREGEHKKSELQEVLEELRAKYPS